MKSRSPVTHLDPVTSSHPEAGRAPRAFRTQEDPFFSAAKQAGSAVHGIPPMCNVQWEVNILGPQQG
ncbi:hypothetical protein MATL_G00093710 [Megalops atlanticus]|uniref:Uncharacterized protein n=1 Tax=Megalops atlanticus TaxID=7932 RepID=A0A9D3Q334_MEGAT|nr:hypothetical protein MATL_G00093710 [Megalops atlanticus]